MQKKEVSDKLQKLGSSITTQQKEVRKSLSSRIDENSQKVQRVIDENSALRKENAILQERLDWIESSQLSNNIIIMGIPEQQWENYESTKQRVKLDSSLKGHVQ